MNTSKLYTAIAAGLLYGAVAQGASVSYIMDQSNVMPDGTPYLQVTIADSGDDITFTVQTLSALTSIAGDNYGIQKFGFNGGSLSASNIVFTGSAAGNWSYSTNTTSDMAEFGIFLNLTNADKGNLRVDPLTFTITGVTGDTLSTYTVGNAKDNFFAAHVGGFDTSKSPDGIDSGFFSGNADGLVPPQSVPVPAAAWLFGSGLVGLIGVARRERKAA